MENEADLVKHAAAREQLHAVRMCTPECWTVLLASMEASPIASSGS
jgi:hypothetical protein